METVGANNRRQLSQLRKQIDTELAPVEAMDTHENDIEPSDLDNLTGNEDTNMQIAPPIVPNANPDDNLTNSGGAMETNDAGCDRDRSEATFSFAVENFSKLKDSILSPPCYVRNLPWKIMVMPRCERNQSESKSLGFFLQCNGESDNTSWSCNAVAELRLKSFKSDQEPFVRKIKHLFYSKENDWGFSYFLSWSDILDPEKGYIQNDTIVLEVNVSAEAPHGVYWDSKKHTGYVGLKNQGATCYMNSLLQTLYFTNQLRKAVYKMPTEADDSSKSVALALQRVFYDLQFSDKPVGTKKLTRSFGWETLDSFMQHDVQEFLRVLLDKLESKMKGTCVEGTVPRLFEGKMSSYIECKNVEYKSTRLETFYDIQLNIKGKKNIYESFQDYVEPETLEGDNKYDAGIHGFQEAEKGVHFISFPPVLHLHLMRFQYDPITDNSVKFNDRFEFYETIDLDGFLVEKEETKAEYILHAVLVHSGDNHGGHYVVYINPKGDGKWCKFDDDVVASCSKKDAIENNYGGIEDELSLNAKHCSNAYMLVYIRKSAMGTVLQEIEQSDIPSELIDKLNEEKHMEQLRRKERADANAYVNVNVVLEECFEVHQSTDLFDLEKVNFRTFKLKRTTTISDLIDIFSEVFKIHQDRMRLWPIMVKGQACRPVYFDLSEEINHPLLFMVETQAPWTIFLEIAPSDISGSLPVFDKRDHILIFFKFYDPHLKRLNYLSYGQYPLQRKFYELVPEINEMLGYPTDTELVVYEEPGPNNVQKISNLNDTLQSVLRKTRDETQGKILIFERRIYEDKLELPTVEDYFRDLLYRIEVTFIDKSNPNEPGFTLELSHRNTYGQMAQAVAQRINTDPNKIQFFKSLAYKDQPGQPLRSESEMSLRDLLAYSKPRTAKKIFYQRLSMDINELENKKQFKCLWVSQNLKEEKEMVLYPNKNGTVQNLLDEATKQIEFSEDSTRKLRLLEISNHKILPPPPTDTPLEHLHCTTSDTMTTTNQGPSKYYRVEEIPRDELNLQDNELLVPVTHFNKEMYNSFGVPFLIKIRQGELFGAVKERIQKKLNVPDKEWEKYKIAIVSAMGRPEYINDDVTLINLELFKFGQLQSGTQQMPCLGLDHLNKSQKRSRYTYLEKAIKIYN